MTDTIFDVYAFKAAGTASGLSPRTMPARLSDFYNVKDYGATGLGTGSDRAAIQAAIDYITTPPRKGGILFFPAGQYLLDGPLIVGSAYDVGIELVGCGKESTQVVKNYVSGGAIKYAISGGNRPTPTFDNLARVRGIGRVNVKATRAGFVIEDCICIAGEDNIACNTFEAKNAAVRGCQGDEGFAANPANSANPHVAPGSIVWAMGSGVISGCRNVGAYDVGIALGGDGCVASGNSIEVCNTALRVGWGPDGAGGVGELPARGCVVQGLQTEKNTVGIDLYNATGCYLAGNFTSGTVGPAALANISSATWSAGVVRALSPGHALGSHSAPRRIQIGLTNAAWNPPNYNSHPGGNKGMAEVTVVDANNFEYPHPADPTGSGASGTGTWTWPATYEMRCRKVYQCVIACHAFQTTVGQATLDLDYDGAADHLGNVFFGGQFLMGVKDPSAGKNWAGWTFIRANGYPSYWNDANVKATPYLSMVFANLPGESGVAEPRVEGQEFYVLAQKSGGGAAGWNEQVTTGTAGRYLVRWDGSMWKRIG